MKKNKIILIIIAIVVVIGLVIGGIFLFKDKTSNSDNPSLSTNDEISPLEEKLQKLEKDYEELKKNNEKYYGVTPHYPNIIELDSETILVSDITTYFSEFPSQHITNLDGNEIIYKDDVDEMITHPEKYDHLLLDETVVKELGYIKEIMDVKISNKAPANEYYTRSSFYYNTEGNRRTVAIPIDYFATKEEFYQACYDMMVEFLSRISEEDIATDIVSKLQYVEVSNLEDSIKNGDYRLLFDAIMNDTVALVHVYENGVRLRVEFQSYVSRNTNKMEPCIYISTEYFFDGPLSQNQTNN